MHGVICHVCADVFAFPDHATTLFFFRGEDSRDGPKAEAGIKTVIL